MPLTILTDDDVRRVVESLTREDVVDLHRALADALHIYSTGTESDDSGCTASNQPSRIPIKGKDGSTTLFMPATSDDGIGVKIVTLAETERPSHSPRDSQTDIPSISFSTPERALTNLSLTSSDSSKQSSISSLSKLTTQSSSSTRERNIPPPSAAKSSTSDTPNDTSPKGSITLLTPSGAPRALINAATLTAFRTALASTLLLKLRASVHTLTVFGAGAQAYWHIHLALLLRGPEIHHLHIINRSFARAQQLLMTIGQTRNAAVGDAFTSGKLRPSILTPEYGEYARLLKEHVRAADVLICTTPATSPLFPGTHLTHTGGRRKGRYIVAIGSYKPHMMELDPDIFRQAVAGPAADRAHGHGHVHVHQRNAAEGGAVVVDTIEGAMREAGEVIAAGIGGRGVVELGELVMLKRGQFAEREPERQGRADADGHHDRAGDAAAKHRDKDKDKLGAGHAKLGALFRHERSRSRSRQRRKSVDHTAAGTGAGTSADPDRAADGGLMDWLERGNVVYKSVGLGLMDVVVGMAVVRLAEARGVGTRVHNF